MIISYHRQVGAGELPGNATAEVHLFLIDIGDINAHASNLIEVLNNTSWIFKLQPIARASYEAIALKTAERLIEIFRSVNGKIESEFGEYMISMSAGDCLQKGLKHTVLPISELWKEKLTGNPGFDFHTETHQGRISFGEAKYSSNDNPYTDAAKQVHSFITEEKDKIDAVHLQHLASKKAIDALIANSRGFAIAFSLHSTDHETILNNALQSDLVKRLSGSCDELYIVGVRA